MHLYSHALYINNLYYAELEVELLDVTGRQLVAEAVGDLSSKSADGAAMETVGSVALH
jgi:hypothetical protein